MDNKATHHLRIASILTAMKSALLEETECYFGGGTAIAMQLNDFRLSTDIDFICASGEGYRQLRGIIAQYSMTGLSELFDHPIKQLRETRADRYGIRCVLEVDGAPIKFEIVREDRIALERSADRMHGVPLLSRIDTFAEKLLANSDRGLDRSVLSRDILDIAAMINAWGAVPIESEHKAYRAYGVSVTDDLQSAAKLLLDNDAYRQSCFQEMQIDTSLQRTITAVLGDLSKGLALQSITPHEEYRPPGSSL